MTQAWRFQKGHKKIGGRSKGTKNRKTIDVVEACKGMCDQAVGRLHSLLFNVDATVSLKAAQLILSPNTRSLAPEKELVHAI